MLQIAVEDSIILVTYVRLRSVYHNPKQIAFLDYKYTL
jgi:hypothetical protein